uniref:Uncharacterized protein n=1 Tax=Arundo donax TaxID=35708 RepID=A0A0A9CE44_ARUDO
MRKSGERLWITDSIGNLSLKK